LLGPADVGPPGLSRFKERCFFAYAENGDAEERNHHESAEMKFSSSDFHKIGAFSMAERSFY